MSCQFFIKAYYARYYAVIIRFAFRKCWTWNKNGFLSWLLNDFQIFLIIELNMNLIFLNMYFNESRMDLFFFFEEKAKNRQSLLSRMTLFIYEENVFFKYNEKKYIKLFFFSSYLWSSIYTFLNDAKKCQKPWFDMSTYLTIQFDNKHGIDYLLWYNYLM